MNDIKPSHPNVGWALEVTRISLLYPRVTPLPKTVCQSLTFRGCLQCHFPLDLPD